jgi:hypothetical protein
MDALSVGDVVRIWPAFVSQVFMFGHQIADAIAEFISSASAAGALTSEPHTSVNRSLAYLLGNDRRVAVMRWVSWCGFCLLADLDVFGRVNEDAVAHALALWLRGVLGNGFNKSSSDKMCRACSIFESSTTPVLVGSIRSLSPRCPRSTCYGRYGCGKYHSDEPLPTNLVLRCISESQCSHSSRHRSASKAM